MAASCELTSTIGVNKTRVRIIFRGDKLNLQNKHSSFSLRLMTYMYICSQRRSKAVDPVLWWFWIITYSLYLHELLKLKLALLWHIDQQNIAIVRRTRSYQLGSKGVEVICICRKHSIIAARQRRFCSQKHRKVVETGPMHQHSWSLRCSLTLFPRVESFRWKN